jgi:toxin YoeB
MRSIVFEGDTWERYGEPLKHALTGLWSRRLSLKDRLIYRFDDGNIYVMAIGGHYER